MTEPALNLAPDGTSHQTSTVEGEAVELPEVTVRAAQLALANQYQPSKHGQLCPVWAVRAPINSCDCWILVGAQRDAVVVLAAALAGCEVQTQGRVRIETQPTNGSPPIVTKTPWGSLGGAEKDVAAWRDAYPGSSYTVESRAVITTSPIVVEGETDGRD